jgi:hypothetical protein
VPTTQAENIQDAIESRLEWPPIISLSWILDSDNKILITPNHETHTREFR